MAGKTRRSPLYKGLQKEALAEQYLSQRGLRLLQRNFRCKLGEIDLIMADGETCVFVEVRYRRHASHGSALETVDYRKQQKLLRTAQFYLVRHGLLERCPSRFDVVAISGADNAIEWIRNAFGQ